MPVYNGKSHIGRTSKTNACNGCGRILPKGSMMTLWSVWRKGFRHRVRLCSGCRSIVYGCKERRPLDIGDALIVRDMCECCDSFPLCTRVQYLRDSEPGDMWFGDMR